MPRRAKAALTLPLLVLSVFACSSDDTAPGDPASPCPSLPVASRFAGGSPDGHADPFGAKATKQARAGRIKDGALIKQPDTARNKVRVGDFAIANSKIAAYIEDKGESDGYTTFGGEILALETVGDDGRPRGLSLYGETLIALSRQTVAPETVTVLNDGSDGKAAVIRAEGTLKNIGFLDTFAGLLRDEYNIPAALDFILEPEAEHLRVRLSLKNTTQESLDFVGKQMVGFFQSSRALTFTEAEGFADAKGKNPWVGFDATQSSFAVRAVGSTLDTGLSVSGFQYFSASGLTVDACAEKTVEYLDFIPAQGNVDGLREAVRRDQGEPAGRVVTGRVQDAAGAAVPGALVHALGADGKYQTRVQADDTGAFSLHAAAGAATLHATALGYPVSQPVALDASATSANVILDTAGAIRVVATEDGSNLPLPVRVQIIPVAAVAAAPAAFGVPSETEGRLHQAFAMNGDITLAVPPGQHRVLVTRGYEYELLDQVVSVAAGKPTEVVAKLKHSVDSAGVMCADFHVHSHYSADSADLPVTKVKSAVADGLDIPFSSEHEWIIDFQPIVQSLGVSKWAHGFPSSELTTFTFGHFGIVPIQPKPDQVNNGAVPWLGKSTKEIFAAVHAQAEKPVLVVNHPSGGGLSSFFSRTGFERAQAKGKGELWSDDFDALEVFNDSNFEQNRAQSVGDWFAILNSGRNVWAVGSSDSHFIRSTPVGYPRTCMVFGHDDPERLTADGVRDVLRSGAATISGGLYLTVEGPGGVRPGGTGAAGAYKIVVQAPSWLSAKSLETIVDGVTTDTVTLTATGAGPGKRYEATVNVQANSSAARHWVVFHASSDADLAPLHPGRKAFAVSNPIFF